MTMNKNANHEDVTLILPDKPPLHEFCSEDADQLMAQELNKLSIQEREKVFHDLHGISDQAHEESPEFVKERLTELESALDERVPVKLAYEMALIIDPDYVTNTTFRLMFLRADLFDPYKAALRLARHFEIKLDLFGKELLCRDITQDDLDEGTLECLYSGWIQELPLRDTAGRVVSVLFGGRSHHSVEQKVS
jgi:hypothetical protein